MTKTRICARCKLCQVDWDIDQDPSQCDVPGHDPDRDWVWFTMDKHGEVP